MPEVSPSNLHATERICLFGGTFDPIHIGHLRIANEALKACSLTRILFVPAANPPHKNAATVSPYEDRFRMVEIACTPYPSFQASRLEAGSEQSYTVDTLEKVQKELTADHQLYFLIGADAFAEIETWKRWEDVIAITQFIVVPRPGVSYSVPNGARVTRLEGIELPVSSSSIRERLAAGENVPEVPVEVREYIEGRKLYQHGGRQPVTALP